MSFNQMTHKQAQTLARFVNALRPDWDAPGIEDALGRGRHLAPAADLAVAAIRAATAPSNRTPAVIALEGPHWRGSESKPQVRYDPCGTCAICGQSEHTCRGRWSDDHEFRAVEKARSIRSAPVPDEIRGAIAAKTAELCRHGVARDHCADHKPPKPTASGTP